MLLDEATVKLHWDVANRSLIVDPSTFYFGETRGVVTGRVNPQGDPADRRYAFELESPGAILAPRDSNEPPIVAQRIAVSGVADLKAKLLNFENAVIQAQDASIAAAGSLGLRRRDPVARHGGDLLADDRGHAEADVDSDHRARARATG